MYSLLPLSYLIIVLVDAWTDRKRKVNHLRGAIIYGVISILVAAVTLILSGGGVLPATIFALLTRAAFFDPARNIFSRKHWLYEGLNKPTKDKSWIDRVEDWTGIPIIIFRIGYIVAYLIYLFYFLLLNK